MATEGSSQTGNPGWRFAGLGGWGMDEEHGVKIPEGGRECHGQCSKWRFFILAVKKVHPGIQGAVHEVSMFISLLAQRNEPKKGPPVSLVPPKAGYPEFMPRMGYSSMLPGLCKLG
jgi:hypothetical protein